MGRGREGGAEVGIGVGVADHTFVLLNFTHTIIAHTRPLSSGVDFDNFYDFRVLHPTRPLPSGVASTFERGVAWNLETKTSDAKSGQRADGLACGGEPGGFVCNDFYDLIKPGSANVWCVYDRTAAPVM